MSREKALSASRKSSLDVFCFMLLHCASLMTFFKPFSAAELAALRHLLREVRGTQDVLAAKLRELFPSDFSDAPRSKVSLVLTGKRGAKNAQLAEQFREAAIAIAKENLTITPDTIRALLERVKQAAKSDPADEKDRATDKAAAELPIVLKLAALATPPPAQVQRAVVKPIGPLGAHAANRIETAPMKRAVDYAKSQPNFNMVVSGPRFTGVSTILLAVEEALRGKDSAAKICRFLVPSVSSPFTVEFTNRLLGKKAEGEVLADRILRVEKSMRHLQDELVDAWELSKPEEPAASAQELNRWLRRELSAPALTAGPRALILDDLDPTDTSFTLEFFDLAVLLDAQRHATGKLSIAIGTRYDADLLDLLGPELRSASSVLRERWHHERTAAFSPGEENDLATKLITPEHAARLQSAMTTDRDFLLGHSSDTHLVAWWRAQRLPAHGAKTFTPLSDLLNTDDETANELAALCKQRRYILEVAALFGWTEEELKWSASKSIEKLGAENQSLARNFLRCAGILRCVDKHPPDTTANVEWVWDKLVNQPWPA